MRLRHTLVEHHGACRSRIRYLFAAWSSRDQHLLMLASDPPTASVSRTLLCSVVELQVLPVRLGECIIATGAAHIF